jgi:hypothetical protein
MRTQPEGRDEYRQGWPSRFVASHDEDATLSPDEHPLSRNRLRLSEDAHRDQVDALVEGGVDSSD